MLYRCKTTTGFTLIELLIAVAVFAILGVMAYGGLNTVLTTQSFTEQVAERLSALQMSIRFLERDIGQLVNRPIRNQFGDAEPAIVVEERPLLRLTHAGWQNPAGQTRSELQRVAYDLNEDERLIRQTWPLLDGADVDSVLQTPLLEKVDAVNIRIMDANKEWRDVWPPPTDEPSAVVPLPIAVEITLTAEPWGEIRRLIALPN
jgi:general secretion pathway protein J